MTLPSHSHWLHRIHQSYFEELRWGNRKRTSEILSGAEELREGWKRGIAKHSTCCRPFHLTLYCPVSMTCWASYEMSAYKSGNDGVKVHSKGRDTDAGWNDASSRRRVANPLEGNRRPGQIAFKAQGRTGCQVGIEILRSEAQCKARQCSRGLGGETSKMARRSSRDTHFAKDFAFLRFWISPFFFILLIPIK